MNFEDKVVVEQQPAKAGGGPEEPVQTITFKYLLTYLGRYSNMRTYICSIRPLSQL